MFHSDLTSLVLSLFVIFSPYFLWVEAMCVLFRWFALQVRSHLFNTCSSVKKWTCIVYYLRNSPLFPRSFRPKRLTIWHEGQVCVCVCVCLCLLFNKKVHNFKTDSCNGGCVPYTFLHINNCSSVVKSLTSMVMGSFSGEIYWLVLTLINVFGLIVFEKSNASAR